MSAGEVYNPLDKKNLGASVAEALLGRKVLRLGDLPPFKGAGIYAIYYQGPFEPYNRMAELNRTDDPQVPIYVGKAIPEGGRKGVASADTPTSPALLRRLKDHAKSIEAASNLSLSDFICRALVVDDIWIPLGESLLIAKFSPLWNMQIDGFGNHDPGEGRHLGLIPRWDVLHPGRSWATKCTPRSETMDQIATEIKQWLAQSATLDRPKFLAEERRGHYDASR